MQPTITLVAPSLDILGGQGIQARALENALRSDGFPVHFVPINPRFPLGLRRLRRIPYLRTVLNEAMYLFGLRELRRADVVHVFSASYWSFLLAPVPAIVAAKLLRKPVILHYHSGEAADHLTRWGRLISPFLKMVDQIVVPSAYLQDVFESHGYRAVVIPNLIDTSLFAHRERIPIRPALVSVRNLEDHYNVENTVLAFARLKEAVPNATLTIAGYGSREKSLRDLVARLNLTGVRFLGRVEPDSLPALYNEADIFLNSSVVDNQPVSILEAFASGLPVVSTPTGDIAAMLCHGEAGYLVVVEDPAAMAEAVSQLLNNPDRARQMAQRARAELTRYGWPSIRDSWTSLYADVLARAAGTPASAPSFSIHA